LGGLLDKHFSVLLDAGLFLGSNCFTDLLPVCAMLSHRLDEISLLVQNEHLFGLGRLVRLENIEDEFSVRHSRVLLSLVEQVVRVLGHLKAGFG